MSVRAVNKPRIVGTSPIQVLPVNLERKLLAVQINHDTQTARVKFGSAPNSSAVAQQQKIEFAPAPTAGNFKLKWNGNTTDALAFNASNSQVQTALRTLAGLGSITVSGNMASGYTVTMTSVSLNGNSTELPLIEVVENTLSIAAVTEVQTLSFSDTPAAGEFTLGYGEAETDPIAFDADAPALQTALRALPGLDQVTVTGDFENDFVITFEGVTGDVAALTAESNTLEDDEETEIEVTVEETTPGVVGVEEISSQVSETVAGTAIDGVLLSKGLPLIFSGDHCPNESVWVLASGASTPVEVIEG